MWNYFFERLCKTENCTRDSRCTNQNIFTVVFPVHGTSSGWILSARFEFIKPKGTTNEIVTSKEHKEYSGTKVTRSREWVFVKCWTRTWMTNSSVPLASNNKRNPDLEPKFYLSFLSSSNGYCWFFVLLSLWFSFFFSLVWFLDLFTWLV